MEEVRVAIVDGERLDKFDFEVPSRAQVKGNIYLAKVVRVEPSLQAAFVDYGHDRHGFLGFSEIHNDYFQIPVNDRRELENHIQNATSALLAETGESGEELDPREIARLRYQFYRRYKIQEVIKKRQIMLVQVIREERGNKGAALTTYISLAGRYCVLMPNTSKNSGISRKVTDPSDRKKLKKIISNLQLENGSTVVRTAGIGHTKSEITKDFNYLKKMWDEIRETTVKSAAPCLIHEEAGLIKRAIRDMYSHEVESIFVEGEEGYKIARAFVKKILPSHAKRVKLYEDAKLPLFTKFHVNDQINQIYSPRVDLPSGGYLVINTTEALISIDVNSGKATRERNVAEMALKTNLEAAIEVARQCRLRDLAGLIVVDFIDMGDRRDNLQVERCLRDALRKDKAKIQVGSISSFGLLEFSRQRLRTSIADANMTVCPHCSGSGFVWSNESIAIQLLRKIEETIGIMESSEINITLSTDVALYLMNHKRIFLSDLERRTSKKIVFKIDGSIPDSEYKMEQSVNLIVPEEEKPAGGIKQEEISLDVVPDIVSDSVPGTEANAVVDPVEDMVSLSTLPAEQEEAVVRPFPTLRRGRMRKVIESSPESVSLPEVLSAPKKVSPVRQKRHYRKRTASVVSEEAAASSLVMLERPVPVPVLPEVLQEQVTWGGNSAASVRQGRRSGRPRKLLSEDKQAKKDGWWKKLLQKTE
ncbi:MAG: Rne/Rng family ribonuclease [Holosporaceae bacterium]|nr:Rne/Rng family ribonuclease [Holosporaceae bacterium]